MREIDLQTWARRNVYGLFSDCDWPFYQVSFPLDVTNLRAYTKKEGLSFYFTLSWLLTKGMEQQEAFFHGGLGKGGAVHSRCSGSISYKPSAASLRCLRMKPRSIQSFHRHTQPPSADQLPQDAIAWRGPQAIRYSELGFGT